MMMIATNTTKIKAMIMIVATMASGTKGAHVPDEQT
jgi:hypothetical protein